MMTTIPLKNNLEYILFRSFSTWLRTQPISRAIAFHHTLGDFWYDVVRIRREVALQNLSQAFPRKSRKEIRTLGRRVFHHFSRVAIEHILMPRFIQKGVGTILEQGNWEVLQSVVDKGKGVVILTGHLGNWELLGSVIALRGYPTSAVAAEQRNQKVDRLINAHRHLAGVKIISRQQAKETIPKIIRQGGIIFLLADQDAGENGVFVPFFGRPASTPPGPAVFALRNRVPLVYATALLHGDRYRIHFEELQVPGKRQNLREAVHHITAFHVSRLEQDIRKYPEQWFWLHRRWKTSAREAGDHG